MTNIGRILNEMFAMERVQKAKSERPQERYARIVIRMDDPAYIGENIEIHASGDYLGKIKYDGDTSCYLRLNNRHAGKIYAHEFRRTYAAFDKIYLTNPLTQDAELILVVGGAFSGEIEPSTGAKSGIIDPSGADVDPANLANQALIVADLDDIREAVETAVAAATNTKISVGSSDTTVLALSATRKFAVFVNDSDEVIYLSLSATAVMNEGIRLNASGGSYEINATNLYTGEVSGICASGTKNLTVSAG